MYPSEFKSLIVRADVEYDRMYDHLPRLLESEILKEYGEFTPVDPIKTYFPPSKCFEGDNGYIYFLQDDSLHPGLLKVGFSKDWGRRLKQHRGYLPNPRIIAVCPGSLTREGMLHDWLIKVCRKHAFREWFHLKKEEIQRLMNDDFCEFEPINYPVIFI